MTEGLSKEEREACATYLQRDLRKQN